MEAVPIKILGQATLMALNFSPSSYFKIKSQFDHSLGLFSVDVSNWLPHLS